MVSRQFFSESEKVCLQKLIIKYKLNSAARSGQGNYAAKKIAWVRLTNEYNAIESNTKRTEAQLKKCWDNIKTRRKQALTQKIRERMRTGGGPYVTMPSTSASTSATDDMVLDAIDVELTHAIDSDTEHTEAMQGCSSLIENPSPVAAPSASNQEQMEAQISTIDIAPDAASDHIYAAGEDSERRSTEYDATRRSGSRLSDYGREETQKEARHVRARLITEEFGLRREKYLISREREATIHELKIKEREFLVKAAQETYLKCKIEREAAEELLRCNKAKREEAELNLEKLKRH